MQHQSSNMTLDQDYELHTEFRVEILSIPKGPCNLLERLQILPTSLEK